MLREGGEFCYIRKTIWPQVVYIEEKGHSRACAGGLKAFDKASNITCTGTTP